MSTFNKQQDEKNGFYEYALRVTENIGKRIKAQTQ